ncbi:DUF2303 family protein [Pyruvatibacter sp.]
MHPENEGRTEVDAVAETVKALYKPDVISIPALGDEPAAQVVAVPDGDGGMVLEKTNQYTEGFRIAPKRAAGRAILTRLDSFVLHVMRHKTEETVIFAAEPLKPSDPAHLLAVYDYHGRVNDLDGSALSGPVGPQFGDHGAKYPFPLSEEWETWFGQDGAIMGQSDFAAFIEDNILDVEEPGSIVALVEEQSDEGIPTESARSAARLLEIRDKLGVSLAGIAALQELSRGLELNVDERIAQRTNLQSGEGEITFTTEHTDSDGQALKVPGMFIIAIPLFKNGDIWRLAVRLRYRPVSGSVKWWFELHRPEYTFKKAFDEVLKDVQAETGCPVLVGKPEASCDGSTGSTYKGD